MSPNTERKANYLDIENLLNATPRQTCLPAGSADLTQSTFKIVKSTNMMRAQRESNDQRAMSKYEALRNEMLARKKAYEDQVAEYKLSLVQAKEKKKQQQAENNAIWKDQLRWKQEKRDSERKEMEAYDPEAVWNIEGPTRRANDLAKRQRDADWTRRTLE